MTKAENSAEDLIFDLGLTLPIVPKDVCTILDTESFSVSYHEKQLSSNKLCGISIGDKTGVEILINTAIKNESRRNFTAAHEIGHTVMHIQTGMESQFKCSNNDISYNTNSNKLLEDEANEFASSLLMPKSLIGEMITSNDLSWQLVQSIANDCGTSLEATARRVVNLSTETCVFIIHKKGEMWKPIKSPSFTTYINKIAFPKNLETTPDPAESNYPEIMLDCDTSDWLDVDRITQDTILYSSIRNEEFDRTMTLIVIPDIDEEDIEAEWDEPSFSK